MWEPPKNDWSVKPFIGGLYQGDWFGLTDYNRVKGNIEHLAELFAAAITPLPTQTQTPIGPTETVLNAIEGALYDLSLLEPGVKIITKTWAGNGKAPTVDDWNRWENNCQALYDAYYQRDRTWADVLREFPTWGDVLSDGSWGILLRRE